MLRGQCFRVFRFVGIHFCEVAEVARAQARNPLLRFHARRLRGQEVRLRGELLRLGVEAHRLLVIIRRDLLVISGRLSCREQCLQFFLAERWDAVRGHCQTAQKHK